MINNNCKFKIILTVLDFNLGTDAILSVFNGELADNDDRLYE